MPLKKTVRKLKDRAQNPDELSGRLHSYSEDKSYILKIVKIVTKVSRTVNAKRRVQCLTTHRVLHSYREGGGVVVEGRGHSTLDSIELSRD